VEKYSNSLVQCSKGEFVSPMTIASKIFLSCFDGNQTLVVTDTDYIGRTTSKYITTAMTAPGEKLKILSLYL
jgi:hypothetical protein